MGLFDEQQQQTSAKKSAHIMNATQNFKTKIKFTAAHSVTL